MTSARRQMASRNSMKPRVIRRLRAVTSQLTCMWHHMNTCFAVRRPTPPRYRSPLSQKRNQPSMSRRVLRPGARKCAKAALSQASCSVSTSATASRYMRARNALGDTSTGRKLLSSACASMRSLMCCMRQSNESETSLMPASLPKRSSATRVSASRYSNRVSEFSSFICATSDFLSSSKFVAMKTLSMSAILQPLEVGSSNSKSWASSCHLLNFIVYADSPSAVCWQQYRSNSRDSTGKFSKKISNISSSSSSRPAMPPSSALAISLTNLSFERAWRHSVSSRLR
mmetsp:Transcript_61/g.141  ORF Transcript_61/g.141 Transcript_61/m.141 type:complete len:285 (-) Transcript_61:612-1466(-)